MMKLNRLLLIENVVWMLCFVAEGEDQDSDKPGVRKPKIAKVNLSLPHLDLLQLTRRDE
jgi:hypothetical protein